jgi:hypothetical protein
MLEVSELRDIMEDDYCWGRICAEGDQGIATSLGIFPPKLPEQSWMDYYMESRYIKFKKGELNNAFKKLDFDYIFGRVFDHFAKTQEETYEKPIKYAYDDDRHAPDIDCETGIVFFTWARSPREAIMKFVLENIFFLDTIRRILENNSLGLHNVPVLFGLSGNPEKLKEIYRKHNIYEGNQYVSYHTIIKSLISILSQNVTEMSEFRSYRN